MKKKKKLTKVKVIYTENKKSRLKWLSLLAIPLVIAVVYFQLSSGRGMTVTVIPSSAHLEINEKLNLLAMVSGGSAPYQYVWYIDGFKVYEGTNTYEYSSASEVLDEVKCEVTDCFGVLDGDKCVITVGDPGPFEVVLEEKWDWEPIAADQGLALSDDGKYLYCSATSYLRKIRLSDYAVLGQVTTTEPDAYHTGDCGYHGGYIYVPVTDWTPVLVTKRYIKVYNEALQLVQKFLLNRSDWEGEAASIDYDDNSGLFWIGDYNTPYVHCYDINVGAGRCDYVESRYIGIESVQGITWLNGKLYVLKGTGELLYQFVNWVNRGSVQVEGHEGLESYEDKIYVGERHFDGSPFAPVLVYRVKAGL